MKTSKKPLHMHDAMRTFIRDRHFPIILSHDEVDYPTYGYVKN